MAAEHTNNHGGNQAGDPAGFNGITGIEAMDEYTERTDEDVSPVLYNNDRHLGGDLP